MNLTDLGQLALPLLWRASVWVTDTAHRFETYVARWMEELDL